MNEKPAVKVVGRVKWFDPSKGFGFVVSADGGADILLHANVLRNYGQSSVSDNARIEVIAQETDRGVQAIEVCHIAPPEEEQETQLADFQDVDPETLANAPMEPVRVKWFDKAKGFGFANAFGREEDIFIHVEVLRRSGLADLFPGEALALRIIDGRRGRMAIEVAAWESAINREDIV